jgi:hypothetical protein
MQRWVYFLWEVGKRDRFWSLFSRRSIRNPLKNLLSGKSSSRGNFKLTIPWASFHSRRQARTLQGYEAIHMMRKGQMQGVSKGDSLRQAVFIADLFEVAI